MKTLRNALFFPLLLLSMVVLMVGGILADQETRQAIAQSGPVVLGEKAPDFAVVTEGTEVVLAWTEIHGAEGYRLLFSFSDGDVEDNSYEIDTGLGTELVLDFGDENILETFSHIESFENIETGLSFHVSVVAYDDEGDSRQSNVEYILVGTDDHVPENEGQLSSISARVGRSFCTLFVEPARSCVLGTDIFVPVGGTSAFTATDGFTNTSGFTCISNDPSIVDGGFASPGQGTGWITGVSEGTTIVRVWDGQGCWTSMSVTVLPVDGNYIYISDFDPAPYPYTKLTAGVYTTFSFRITFPPVSGRYYRIRYDLGNLAGTANSNSEKAHQIVFNDIQKLEALTRAANWTMPLTVAGTIPFGWDYLVIWVEYLDSDQTTVLAESCKAGWLIDQVLVNQ
ncbi:MAG: hypothetical protein B6I30_00030 [Desulfobacteraceae bacterium 4572_187]|nr:MAG: hypothetical protein B6I30_00030 [Desulfobacteraceae bacterium 4572_187]